MRRLQLGGSLVGPGERDCGCLKPKSGRHLAHNSWMMSKRTRKQFSDTHTSTLAQATAAQYLKIGRMPLRRPACARRRPSARIGVRCAVVLRPGVEKTLEGSGSL